MSFRLLASSDFQGVPHASVIVRHNWANGHPLVRASTAPCPTVQRTGRGVSFSLLPPPTNQEGVTVHMACDLANHILPCARSNLSLTVSFSCALIHDKIHHGSRHKERQEHGTGDCQSGSHCTEQRREDVGQTGGIPTTGGRRLCEEEGVPQDKCDKCDKSHDDAGVRHPGIATCGRCRSCCVRERRVALAFVDRLRRRRHRDAYHRRRLGYRLIALRATLAEEGRLKPEETPGVRDTWKSRRRG